MRSWLDQEILAEGRLPLLLFFLGFIGGFLCIRISVRLIRAEVKWWFSNINAGGHHIHHVVFGVVINMLSGMALIAVSVHGSQTSLAVLAAFFGLGSALILDEFALIFYLRDVYWSEEGRASVDAVFVAIAVTGMVLLGFRPFALFDPTALLSGQGAANFAVEIFFAAINLGLAAIVLLKGKIWTGLIGLFFWPLLLVGTCRLARPGSPWARWRYQNRRKMRRAMRRERSTRRPLIRAKIYLQDLMAGSPDVPHAKQAAEEWLNETIHPAPAPEHHRGGIFESGPKSGTMSGLPDESHRQTTTLAGGQRPRESPDSANTEA